MRITAVSPQLKNKNRVNIFVDNKYRFSLDINQLVELGVKTGNDYDEAGLVDLEQASRFGKLYNQTLVYCLTRPRSKKEVQDYLNRKALPTRYKNGELKPGLTSEMTANVLDHLIEKNYIDDLKFAKYWIENRFIKKGISRRKLTLELHTRGVENSIIADALSETNRDEIEELHKIIIKKRASYPDERKFMQYLSRHGFGYDDIKQALIKCN